MSVNVIIRPMGVNDIVDIMRIRTSVRENHMSVDDLAAENITPQTIKEMIETTPCPAWVALYHDTMIGFSVIGFSMVDFDDGCIFALFVDKKYHGIGAGKKLLQQAEAALFKTHQKIWLITADETRAAQFYRKQNWHEVSRDDHNDLRLEKLYCEKLNCEKT